LKEQKGVSPVVGTILLIAVTVALAAVVATLVGGLGTSVIPPSVQLTTTARVENENLILTITHGNGPNVNLTDLRLVVTHGATQICDNAFGDYLQGFKPSFISVGHDYVEKIPLIGISLTSNDTITVRVTHTPSSSTLYSANITIS
jgi:flagellin-like protein